MIIIKDKIFDSVRKTVTDAVDGKCVQLGRHDCLVLLKLIESFGRTVTRNELFAGGWPNRIVTDNSLNASIKRIRDALDDSDKLIIKSRSGVGYELVVEPQLIPDTCVITVNEDAQKITIDTEAGLTSQTCDGNILAVKPTGSINEPTKTKSLFNVFMTIFIFIAIEVSFLEKIFFVPTFSIDDVDGRCTVLLNLFTEEEQEKIIMNISTKHEYQGCSYYFNNLGHIMVVTKSGFKEL